MANRQSSAPDGKTDSLRDSLRTRVAASSYSAVCRELRISKGALWKFINTTYVPSNPRLYRAFGLGELITMTVRRDRTGRFAPKEDPLYDGSQGRET